MKQKATPQKSTQLIDDSQAISVCGGNSVFVNLAASLVEIRKLKGVRGYILRSNSSAIIDLTQRDKVTDYAVLSTQIYEASREMAKHFSLTDVESVLVEGREVKVLCMSIGENKMSIFMDKNASHSWIIKRILL
jgi:predicted regulator of Ras-like GTPase activity (Roadblock/LC7/MglB family)